MTDTPLREAVVKAIGNVYNDDAPAVDNPSTAAADAAIALMRPVIRAETLEEAAKVADRAVIPMCETSADRIAAAIRALKEKLNG